MTTRLRKEHYSVLLLVFLCTANTFLMKGRMYILVDDTSHMMNQDSPIDTGRMNSNDAQEKGERINKSLSLLGDKDEIKENTTDTSNQSFYDNSRKGSLLKIQNATATSSDLNGTHCFSWNEEADKWWEIHPEYGVVLEDDSKLCFAPIRDSIKAAFFKDLYAVQHNASNCQNTITKKMWSSGYGADFLNVADGLAYALQTKRPFQITQKGREQWHYSAFKERFRKGRKPVCPSADMFCYFLPLGICKPGEIDESDFLANDDLFFGRLPWLREFATRPQQWLRRRVMKYIATSGSNFTINNINDGKVTKCAAIHIRRTDVVLGGDYARKYFAVQEYLDGLKAAKHGSDVKNVYLFTDDADAVDEALEFHPDYNWMYLRKKRHRGREGGWENQLPGDSPAEEVIAMLAEFRLAQDCNFLVHTESSYSEVIYDSMVTTGKHIERIKIDEGTSIYDQNNTNSEYKLKSLLKKKRVGEGISKNRTTAASYQIAYRYDT